MLVSKVTKINWQGVSGDSRLVGRRHGDVSTTAFPRDCFRVPIVTVRAAATAKWAHRTCLAFDLERSFWWCCTHQSDGEQVVTASPLNGVSDGAWCLESSGAPTTKVHIVSSLPTTRRNSSHKITFCKWVAHGGLWLPLTSVWQCSSSPKLLALTPSRWRCCQGSAVQTCRCTRRMLPTAELPRCRESMGALHHQTATAAEGGPD
jgi:hypothetical protein